MAHRLTMEQEQSLSHWLSTRRTLMRDYWQLVKLPPYEKAPELHPSIFLQELIDYIAQGHFKVFSLIDTEQPCYQLLNQQLLQTTHFLVDINDQFDDHADEALTDNWLSQLGEVLAYRFELEDKLIASFQKQTVQVN